MRQIKKIKPPKPGKSLSDVAPNALLEWDYEKNSVDPSKVGFGSAFRVWWKCRFGHEWQVGINSRTSSSEKRERITGCAICSGNTLDPQKNLLVLNPEIAKMWSPKNSTAVTSVSPKNGDSFLWICEKGHEFKKQVLNLVKTKGACPECKGKTLASRSVSVAHPLVAAQWDLTRNTKGPHEVFSGSHYKAHWVCPKGHRWRAPVSNRTMKKGNSCPFCFGTKIATPESCVASNPELMKIWNHDKNTLSPNDIRVFSTRMLHWKCSQGHEWEQTCEQVSMKIKKRGAACGRCSKSFTSLERNTSSFLELPKFDKRALVNAKFKPDFQLSDQLFVNVDGARWHSDEKVDHEYHVRMRESYEAENKRILQFHEDEVQKLPFVVEYLCDTARKKPNTNKTFMLNNPGLKYAELEPKEARDFFSSNELKALVCFPENTTGAVAIKNGDHILAAMALDEQEDEITVLWHTENHKVVFDDCQYSPKREFTGYLKRMHHDKRIFLHLDLRYESPKDWEKFGFVVKKIEPNKWFVGHKEKTLEPHRKHRFVVRGAGLATLELTRGKWSSI